MLQIVPAYFALFVFLLGSSTRWRFQIDAVRLLLHWAGMDLFQRVLDSFDSSLPGIVEWSLISSKIIQYQGRELHFFSNARWSAAVWLKNAKLIRFALYFSVLLDVLSTTGLFGVQAYVQIRWAWCLTARVLVPFVCLSSREPNTTRWCGGCGLFDLLNVTTTTTMKKVTSRFVRFLLITLKVNA